MPKENINFKYDFNVNCFPRKETLVTLSLFLQQIDVMSLNGLTNFVEPNQLPTTLNGHLQYPHQTWLEMRLAVDDLFIKANKLLDSYNDINDQVIKLVIWLDEWKWERSLNGHVIQPDSQFGVDYFKECLWKLTGMRKKVVIDQVDQLASIVADIQQK